MARHQKSVLNNILSILFALSLLLVLLSCAAKTKVPTADDDKSDDSEENIKITPLDVNQSDLAADAANASNSDEKSGGLEELQATLKLERVHFDFDAYTLSEEGKKVVEANLEKIKGMTELKIKVVGHCDARGSNEYNIALGFKRSSSIAKYLENLGLSTDRIKVESLGEEMPVLTESTEAAYQENRRGEFWLEKS
jgi:peptidoglycan-associated lipoprotein